MAALRNKLTARTVLFGFAFLLLFFETITNELQVLGEVIRHRDWPEGHKNIFFNDRHTEGNLLELENGNFPAYHWQSWNNAHKKKQYPRSSISNIRNIQNREGISRNYYLKVNAERTIPSFPLDRPVLRPAGNFDPKRDAEKLLSALRSKLLNDDEIISVMTKRTDDQRQAVARQYPNLKQDLSLKLSFGFRELMKALATPLHQFHAEQLNEAFRFNSKLDVNRVIELLCTLNNRLLKSVRQNYRTLYRKDIDDELRKFSDNPIASFLISYTVGNRDERNAIDTSLATYDAQQLQNAGSLRIDEGTPFRKILISRSFPQLKLTFSEYRRLTGKSIKDGVRKSFSGDVQKALVNIVRSVSNRPQYFAEILNAAIRNFSTRDATLIRVIVLRSEIDMGDIKSAYRKQYDFELSASIPTNTGSLKKALISLLSE